MTIWFEEGVADLWSAPRRMTRGGQTRYSDLATADEKHGQVDCVRLEGVDESGRRAVTLFENSARDEVRACRSGELSAHGFHSAMA